MSYVPKKILLVKGKGYHKSKLGSFEEALRDAAIARFNLVEVSSIFPTPCVETDKKKGLELLKTGQIVHVVMSKICSDEYNRLISASIGVAKPLNGKKYGYLSEYHSFGEGAEKVGDFAEDVAAEMLASTLGVPFDLDANYDDKEEIFKMNGEIVTTKNITESAIVRKKGEWLTVLAAAIFIE
ncbi:MAG: pyruvoyl-dependent arginine decarboxylase [Promethearchaeia archaeon]